MKGTVVIVWEHGCGLNETTKHKMDDVNPLLKFLFELRGFNMKTHWFDDDHDKREGEFVRKLHKKWDHQFESVVPSDRYYSDYRPSMEKIYIKVGNKIKYIVWGNILNNKALNLPKIGETINTTTGAVCRHGRSVYGGKWSDYLGFEDFDEIGMGLLGPKKCGTKERNYAPISGKVIDIRVDMDGLSSDKTDFTDFNYVILAEYIGDEFKGQKFTTNQRGYDENLHPEILKEYQDSLYFFQG